MSTEQNKAILRRWFEAWNTRSVSALVAMVDEIFTADFAVHNNAPPAVTMGREGVKQFVRDGLKRTPDFHMAIEDMIAEGDKVVIRATSGGTDASTGKPTGTLISYTFRFAGSKIAELWAFDVPLEPGT